MRTAAAILIFALTCAGRAQSPSPQPPTNIRILTLVSADLPQPDRVRAVYSLDRQPYISDEFEERVRANWPSGIEAMNRVKIVPDSNPHQANFYLQFH
jgi:hypothetical protein